MRNFINWSFYEEIFTEELDFYGWSSFEEYYGVGDLLIEAFLINELSFITSNGSQENNINYLSIVKRLNEANFLSRKVNTYFMKELYDINDIISKLCKIDIATDQVAEKLIMDYINKAKNCISTLARENKDYEEVFSKIVGYLNEKKEYHNLLKYISKINDDIIDYCHEKDNLILIKKGKPLIRRIDNIIERLPEFHVETVNVFHYLNKVERRYKIRNGYCIYDIQYPIEFLKKKSQIIVKNIINIAEAIQQKFCSRNIYDDNYFNEAVSQIKKYIENCEKDNILKNYTDDNRGCFSIFDVIYNDKKSERFFSFSGVWDGPDDILNHFKETKNNAVAQACKRLETILKATWVTISDDVKNYIMDKHGDMVCVGNLRMFIDNCKINSLTEKEIKNRRRDFSCCERKFFSYINNNVKIPLKRCMMYVKFQPCEKCIFALNEFKKQQNISKYNFYIEHARTDEIYSF